MAASDPLELKGIAIGDTKYKFGDLLTIANSYIYHVEGEALLAKVIKIRKESQYNEFAAEYEIAKRAGDVRIGPVIHSLHRFAHRKKEFAVMVMQKLNATNLTHVYYDETPENRRRLLTMTHDAWNQLYNMGIDYFPEHSDNVLYDRKSDKIYLIDYGTSSVSKQPIAKQKRKFELDIINRETGDMTWTKLTGRTRSRPRSFTRSRTRARSRSRTRARSQSRSRKRARSQSRSRKRTRTRSQSRSRTRR